MKIAKSILAIAGSLLAVILALVGLAVAMLDVRVALSAPGNAVPESVELPWDSRRNRMQEGNTCGAHAVMAVLAVENSADADPYRIYDEIPEKLGRGYVYPWGLTRYLGRNGVPMRSSLLGLLSRADKARWLRAKLGENHPVIVIVGTKKYLHYITLLGYARDDFYVYDSMLGNDLNYEKPGNITLPEDEILNNMASAYFGGIYLNMAIGTVR